LASASREGTLQEMRASQRPTWIAHRRERRRLRRAVVLVEALAAAAGPPQRRQAQRCSRASVAVSVR
jgi:hypothetical protein